MNSEPLIHADQISAAADVVTALIALCAAWFGVREFVRSGRWKAAELAAAHLQRLTTEETLAFACQSLDWGTGPLVVPAALKPIATRDVYDHDVAVLQQALQPQLDTQTLANPQGLLYRHCFDRLFAFLDSAQELLDLGLVEPRHLFGLRYWLRHLARWEYAKTDKAAVFPPALIAFGYGRVLRLFDSLDVPVVIPAAMAARAEQLKNDAAPK